MEEESDLTVTELKEMAAEKARQKMRAKMEAEKGAPEEAENAHEGISWGMADDATEEDIDQNPDMTKNPFALEPQNEELYLDDPKKTLKGWFEREGFELEYKCVEKGYATFTCTVELPINEVLGSGGSGPTIAEATVKGGKKKEAVVQAALEACRILDRFNLLRQSNQESKAKRQLKKWKEDDYYDSDEDEFLDRTGTIEAKRKKRMQMEAKEDEKTAPQPIVDTYETLQDKYALLEKTIADTEKEIKEAVEALNAAKKLQTLDSDDLDAFMAGLKKTEKSHGGREHISKLRQLLLTQQNELKRLEKLVKIARPTEMPKLKPVTSKSSLKGVMIGKRFGLGGAKNLRTLEVKPKPAIEEPVKSVRDETAQLSNDPAEKASVDASQSLNEHEREPLINGPRLHSNQEEENELQPLIKGPHFPSNHEEETLIKGPRLTSDHEEEHEQDLEPPKPKKRRPKSRRKEGTADDKTEENAEDHVPGDYDTSDPKYATWLPPQNQSGDGRTSLNDKYGY